MDFIPLAWIAMLDAFQAEAAAIDSRSLRCLDLKSDGKLVERDFPVDAKYWRRHLR